MMLNKGVFQASTAIWSDLFPNFVDKIVSDSFLSLQMGLVQLLYAFSKHRMPNSALI